MLVHETHQASQRFAPRPVKMEHIRQCLHFHNIHKKEILCFVLEYPKEQAHFH